MSWTNDEKPSTISNPIWSSVRYPWDETDFSYIEFIWQYIPTYIWTNETI